jgi:flagellar motor switch protein FliN/FliY
MTQEEIDALINSGALEEAEGENQDNFESDSGSQGETDPGVSLAGGDPKLELLFDLQLPVSIELGRTNMLIKDILRLGRGSVIEFDKLVSEPVDVIINGKKVAEGEVVVIDKHFGIRVTTLVDPAERMRAGRK